MYRTILIPLDRSPGDRVILEHVRPLARLMGSRLVLAHVAEGHVARNQEELDLADSEEMIESRIYLAERAEELRKSGFVVETHLGRGDPAPEILAMAEREGADLIAMSTRGHGAVLDLLLGSVASGVRHGADVPVLLVRGRRGHPAS